MEVKIELVVHSCLAEHITALWVWYLVGKVLDTCGNVLAS